MPDSSIDAAATGPGDAAAPEEVTLVHRKPTLLIVMIVTGMLLTLAAAGAVTAGLVSC